MPPAMVTVTGREASANRCRQDLGDREGTAGTNNKKPSAGFNKVVHDCVLKTSGSSVGRGGQKPKANQKVWQGPVRSNATEGSVRAGGGHR